MNKKRKTRITEALQTLNKTDVYSLLLFTIFKMHDIPEYASLSELCYVLDGNNMSKFLAYYGGMTIKIPTLRDMRLMTQALLLFQYVNLEKGSFDEALEVVCGNEFTATEITEAYKKITEVVANYDFSRN